MRDINRIEPFLKKVRDLWILYPDYRFGQIIYLLSAEMDTHDVFFPEEKEWELSIDSLIQKSLDNNKK